jgi:hypothetical protein
MYQQMFNNTDNRTAGVQGQLIMITALARCSNNLKATVQANYITTLHS